MISMWIILPSSAFVLKSLTYDILGLYLDGLAPWVLHASALLHATEKQFEDSMKAKWQCGISQQIRRHLSISLTFPWSRKYPDFIPPTRVTLSKTFPAGQTSWGFNILFLGESGN